MKTFMLAFAAAALLSSSAMAQQTKWIGFSVTGAPTAQVIQRGPFETESAAWDAVKTACENKSGVTCGKESYIAVPQGWLVAAFVCNGDSFIGGSQPSVGNQIAVTMGKARMAGHRPQDCEQLR